MGMLRTMRCVGGPWDGEDITSSADLLVIDGAPDMAYHRTRPTDTDWRDTYDHDWFMHGASQPPPPPAHVWEWHERDWESPEVAYIGDAIRDVSARRVERAR